MNGSNTRTSHIPVALLALLWAACAPAFADHRGHGFAPSHAGAVRGFGGGARAFRPQVGMARPLWRPGFGARGWAGGYWHRPLWYGAYVPFLPLYFDTYWWAGVPYYFADGYYYRWLPGPEVYEVVPPPAGVGAAAPADLFVYPKGGQSPEQLAQDRRECQQWAATQANGASRDGQAEVLRAQGACLEGRGYTVK